MLDPTLNPGPDYRLVICVIVKQVHEAKCIRGWTALPVCQNFKPLVKHNCQAQAAEIRGNVKP